MHYDQVLLFSVDCFLDCMDISSHLVHSYFHTYADFADAYFWLPSQCSGTYSTVCDEHHVVCEDFERTPEDISQETLKK